MATSRPIAVEQKLAARQHKRVARRDFQLQNRASLDRLVTRVCSPMHTLNSLRVLRCNDLRAIPEFVCGLVCRLHSRARGPTMTTVPRLQRTARSPALLRWSRRARRRRRRRDRRAAADSPHPARRSPRCRRSSSRCANARRGWRTSATPTTRACAASIASRCPDPGLSIVSDHVEGTRLSDILRVAHERNLQLDINAALCLIRQLVPAVALLHENAREVAHGLIAPGAARRDAARAPGDRRARAGGRRRAAAVRPRSALAGVPDRDAAERRPAAVRSPRGRHRRRAWSRSRSSSAGRSHAAEFPNHLPTLLNEARERTALGEEQPLSQPLRDWLARALQLDTRRAFASAPEALTGARGDRRRRFDVRRGAGRARDVPVALHRGAARAADPIPAPQASAFVPAPRRTLRLRRADRRPAPAAPPAASYSAAFEALLSPPAASAVQPAPALPLRRAAPRACRRLRPPCTTRGPTPLRRRALGPRRATSPS